MKRAQKRLLILLAVLSSPLFWGGLQFDGY